jgi:hypothetical protein
MAREKLSKEVDRTARCENGHEFPVKQEYVGHDSGEELGYQNIIWKPGNAIGYVECPKCRSTRIELVEE